MLSVPAPTLRLMTERVDLMADKAIGLLIDSVRQVPPAGWERPSNLAGWSVRDLVGHATGSAAKIVALVAGEQIWQGPSRPSEWLRDDPVRYLRELADRLRAALPAADLDAPRTSPQGEVPLRRALIFPVCDLALHSWDIHRCLGRQVELPPDLLALCQGLVESLPEEMLRRPGAFGPAQPAPENSSATARLMAFLGRSVEPPS
ncbi:maleylpyruvate isomerase family mycothiol-dependent enzyme [Mycobacterium avium subsp. hominissuis]|nr:TIGR03086 family protein [Mycobacterium avium]MBZ4559479.1 TIGR03086 family protein [Mycobacterium avium subsp. hominissuis]MBZ4569000.1 TIGR03086 family protein [Mycobacterium avium subsp. hominissuis]MBZ4588032.1 TIGR03086 family protein [Mycobacterium avium subsp. hominissuis]MBZ4625533.1 TIGR03086 family protein [Mycobacterium avium subsp. hominissuis]